MSGRGWRCRCPRAPAGAEWAPSNLYGDALAVVAVPDGHGFKQIGELALAFGLCSLTGLEREWRAKSTGLRTHTLVGFGVALFTIVSKYRASTPAQSGAQRPPRCAAIAVQAWS